MDGDIEVLSAEWIEIGRDRGIRVRVEHDGSVYHVIPPTDMEAHKFLPAGVAFVGGELERRLDRIPLAPPRTPYEITVHGSSENPVFVQLVIDLFAARRSRQFAPRKIDLADYEGITSITFPDVLVVNDSMAEYLKGFTPPEFS